MERAAVDSEDLGSRPSSANSYVALDKSLNISELHFFSAEWNQPPSCRVAMRIKRNNVYERTLETIKCKTLLGGLLIVMALLEPLQTEAILFITALRILKISDFVVFLDRGYKMLMISTIFSEKWNMEWDYLITGGMWLTCVEAKYHLEIHDPPLLSHPTQNCEYTSRPF